MGWNKSNQRCFYFFFHHAAFISIVLTLRVTWRGFLMLRMRITRGAPKWTADWTHCESPSWHLLYIVWPFYIFLVVITSAFSLWVSFFSLFFSFIHFVLQASAICTVLESEFRQDVQLRSLMKNDINDKIKKWLKKDSNKLRLRLCLYFAFMQERLLLCVGLGNASSSCAVHGAPRGNKYGAILRTKYPKTFHLIERVIDFSHSC